MQSRRGPASSMPLTGVGSGPASPNEAVPMGNNLSTTLNVHQFATRWRHKVMPSKRLKTYARSGILQNRVVGEALEQAVGLVDASVAHKRKIRTLFAELEAHEKAAEEGDGEQGREVNPAVRIAWQDVRMHELRVAKKMNDLRHDDAFKDTILPVRTIQQLKAYCTAIVALLKTYIAVGVRMTAPEITEIVTQTNSIATTVGDLAGWAGEAMTMLGAERERVRDLRQQVAQVSRGATVAHKEIISLEAKLVDGRKEIEKERNISKQLRLESESGGLRTLMLEIEDSVLAVGMKLIRLDEDGNPLSDVQAALRMIRKLRTTCLSRQDHIARIEFSGGKMKADLEQAELTIANMQAAVAKPRRSKKKNGGDPSRERYAAGGTGADAVSPSRRRSVKLVLPRQTGREGGGSDDDDWEGGGNGTSAPVSRSRGKEGPFAGGSAVTIDLSSVALSSAASLASQQEKYSSAVSRSESTAVEACKSGRGVNVTVAVDDRGILAHASNEGGRGDGVVRNLHDPARRRSMLTHVGGGATANIDGGSQRGVIAGAVSVHRGGSGADASHDRHLSVSLPPESTCGRMSVLAESARPATESAMRDLKEEEIEAGEGGGNQKGRGGSQKTGPIFGTKPVEPAQGPTMTEPPQGQGDVGDRKRWDMSEVSHDSKVDKAEARQISTVASSTDGRERGWKEAESPATGVATSIPDLLTVDEEESRICSSEVALLKYVMRQEGEESIANVVSAAAVENSILKREVSKRDDVILLLQSHVEELQRRLVSINQNHAGKRRLNATGREGHAGADNGNKVGPESQDGDGPGAPTVSGRKRPAQPTPSIMSSGLLQTVPRPPDAPDSSDSRSRQNHDANAVATRSQRELAKGDLGTPTEGGQERCDWRVGHTRTRAGLELTSSGDLVHGQEVSGGDDGASSVEGRSGIEARHGGGVASPGDVESANGGGFDCGSRRVNDTLRSVEIESTPLGRVVAAAGWTRDFTNQIDTASRKHRRDKKYMEKVGAQSARADAAMDGTRSVDDTVQSGAASRGMSKKQERALKAFLQGVDDTHANLAFQALRQEPFVMEEFAFLANRIKELHEAANSHVPRHISYTELRGRLGELSARGTPLLRQLRARYQRLHARWATNLLEALTSRGLAAGDADVSLTCSLCGYDWRRAQPRENHYRSAFHGLKRGNGPTRKRPISQKYQKQAETKIVLADGAVVVPTLGRLQDDRERDDPFLQFSKTSGSSGSGRSTGNNFGLGPFSEKEPPLQSRLFLTMDKNPPTTAPSFKRGGSLSSCQTSRSDDARGGTARVHERNIVFPMLQ